MTAKPTRDDLAYAAPKFVAFGRSYHRPGSTSKPGAPKKGALPQAARGETLGPFLAEFTPRIGLPIFGSLKPAGIG